MKISITTDWHGLNLPFDIDKMLALLQLLVDYFAPIFLVLSPITSYADQILSIQRNKNSDGFSLDIPLIMLVASILK
jgi:solute carrier family 66, member 2